MKNSGVVFENSMSSVLAAWLCKNEICDALDQDSAGPKPGFHDLLNLIPIRD